MTARPRTTGMSDSPDLPDAWGIDVAEGVALSAGVVRSSATRPEEERLHDGLKSIVVLSGALSSRLAGGQRVNVSGPQACVVLNRASGAVAEQMFSTREVHFAMVRINLPHLERYLGPLANHPWSDRETSVTCLPAGAAIATLATQILNCPLQGTVRRLFLAGKSLELVALLLHAAQEGSPAIGACQLTSDEIERLRLVHRRVRQDFGAPHTLLGLSREAGLNVRKLTDGYRTLFGRTIFEHLQDCRMENAYALLASGEKTVAEAAAFAGYSVAHFSTQFRRRFGVEARSLRIAQRR